MEYVRLGKTNLLISRVALGAFRLVDSKSEKIEDEAAQIVRKAYDEGINFYDASRKIENSEKLLGDALYDIKKNVFISTTTSARTVSEIKSDLELSLNNLHCDSLDLYQFETEKFLPLPHGADNIYDTLLELKNENKKRVYYPRVSNRNRCYRYFSCCISSYIRWNH